MKKKNRTIAIRKRIRVNTSWNCVSFGTNLIFEMQNNYQYLIFYVDNSFMVVQTYFDFMKMSRIILIWWNFSTFLIKMHDTNSAEECRTYDEIDHVGAYSFDAYFARTRPSLWFYFILFVFSSVNLRKNKQIFHFRKKSIGNYKRSSKPLRCTMSNCT